MMRDKVKVNSKETLPFPEPGPLLNARLIGELRQKGRLIRPWFFTSKSSLNKLNISLRRDYRCHCRERGVCSVLLSCDNLPS